MPDGREYSHSLLTTNTFGLRDQHQDPTAVKLYASEAAKQPAPPPWVLRDGWYVNDKTGARQRQHPLVDTLKVRPHTTPSL